MLIRALKDWVASRAAVARPKPPARTPPQGRPGLASLQRWIDGDAVAAEALAARVLEAYPGDPDANHVLALAAHGRAQYETAVERFSAALEQVPVDDLHARTQLLSNRGDTLLRMGDLERGLADLESSLALRPAQRKAQANRLFVLPYRARIEPETIAGAHAQWAQRFADPFTPAAGRFTNAADPARRLRIGYVSPDLRRHAVASLLEPILEAHDATNFEVWLYACRPGGDEVTGRLRARAHGWRELHALDDDAAARRIGADGVDILVDLAGHTAGNRLGVFARKPAPVQMTHLGYLSTTGLRAIDYRIGDGLADPPGESEHLYVEELLRMPRCVWCHRPSIDSPPVDALPALARGHVTFGSFNRPAKLSAQTIDFWAAVLRAIPDSRMLIGAVESWETRLRLQDELAARGIAEARLAFRGELPHRELLALRNEVDLSLDTFPCNGGITTCDSLWMGVPVVARLGRGFHARLALTLSTAAGLPGLVAQDEAGAVQIAVRLAGDLEGLAALRRGLRERLAASDLHDARGYTRALEALYREAWRRWCARARAGGVA